MTKVKRIILLSHFIFFININMAITGEIHQAIEEDNIKLVQQLIARSSNIYKVVNQPDDNGFTPLHYTASKVIIGVSFNSNAEGTSEIEQQNKPPAIAALLVNYGADVNTKSKSGLSPLLLAIKNNNPSLAKFLIKKGAKVNIAVLTGKEKGFTPLHYAVFHNNRGLIKLLIAKGTPVNARADNGQTPLHTAAFFDRVLPAELLIKAGADVNVKTKDLGETPLTSALRDGNLGVANLLRKYGAKE